MRNVTIRDALSLLQTGDTDSMDVTQWATKSNDTSHIYVVAKEMGLKISIKMMDGKFIARLKREATIAHPITIKHCLCGYSGCKDFWLVGVGKFVQGSGFTEPVASRIAELLNQDPVFQEMKDKD